MCVKNDRQTTEQTLNYLWQVKFHYRIHDIQPLALFMIQLNTFHILPPTSLRSILILLSHRLLDQVRCSLIFFAHIQDYAADIVTRSWAGSSRIWFPAEEGCFLTLKSPSPMQPRFQWTRAILSLELRQLQREAGRLTAPNAEVTKEWRCTYAGTALTLLHFMLYFPSVTPS